MGRIVSAIARDGSVVCYAMDSTDIVSVAQYNHHTSKVATAALGRMLTAASIMGSLLKGDQDSLTLRIKGDGPIGAIIAVSDSSGNVRGYVENPMVEIPLNSYGKLDVGGAVGKNGTLHVMKDVGLLEPSTGLTQIVSGEIAEDITHYYATSEQVPTVCALGVLVNPDLSVQCSGGFLLQLLPGAADDTIEKIEKTLETLPPVTTLLAQGKTPQQLAEIVLAGFEPEIINTFDPVYRCNCSRSRVEGALLSLGKVELELMALEKGVTKVDCHFCPKLYRFNSEELKQLASTL